MTLRRPLFVMCFIFMAISPLHAQGQVHQWSQRFGDASDQSGRNVAADPSGNVIVTGPFQGTVDFGGGPLTSAGGEDVYVAKFDPGGTHLWSHRFGDAHDQTVRGVVADASGNVIVVGLMAGTVDFGGGPLTSTGWDTFVAKFDPDGNHLWSQLFSADANPWGVAVDTSGNVIVVGWFRSTLDFGGGPLTSAGMRDIYVAKFDPNGNHVWSQRFGDVDHQVCYGVAADALGHVLVTGKFDGTMDLGGGPLTSAGGYDIFVAKFDSNGDHLWSQRFGDASEQSGWAVAVDGAGNVIVSSRFWGTVDFGGGPLTSAGNQDIYVARFDPGGSHLWSQRFGDADVQEVWGLAVDASGNVIVGGSFSGTMDFGGGPLTSAGNQDIYVAKFDPSGGHYWSQRFGDADDQRGGRVAAGASGDVVLASAFPGTVDFGGGPLTSAGGTDICLAKFDLSPAVPTTLQGFHSYWLGNHVEVVWRLFDTSQELSFEVSRAEGPSAPFRSLHNAVVYRRGEELVFEDHNTGPGTKYRYRVIIYEAGESVTSFVAELNTPSATFALAQNSPNPFNPSTMISFSLDQDAFAMLAVYDVAGRLVRTLVSRNLAPGRHSEVWDGKDADGVEVVSGIYFYRLKAGDRVIKRKMLLLK